MILYLFKAVSILGGWNSQICKCLISQIYWRWFLIGIRAIALPRWTIFFNFDMSWSVQHLHLFNCTLVISSKWAAYHRTAPNGLLKQNFLPKITNRLAYFLLVLHRLISCMRSVLLWLKRRRMPLLFLTRWSRRHMLGNPTIFLICCILILILICNDNHLLVVLR